MLLRSLLALPVAATMVGAQVPARDLDVFVGSVIKVELAREKAPGAGFAFVKNGRVIMQRGYGLANVATGVRSDPIHSHRLLGVFARRAGLRGGRRDAARRRARDA